MKQIGLLGGTFDPPHLGHLIIAEEVRANLGLDEIWFIPSQEPPHKQKATTDAVDRAEMVRYAISTNEYFKLNPIEIERPGKSFTIDTIRQLRDENPNTDFYFIIGADMVEYLPKWKDIEELTELVKFVGVERQGYKVKSEYPVIKVQIPTIEVSSTAIRERLQNGISVKYQVPEPVETYIKEKDLYE
ncbi:nicotinate-nucleotide adenylyltransferase [Virgibacillus kekensis]|uniref:Probable nicotinate-nucleotide adenylyltransferase n=1 Tax=Virgibacillus kekensis TaxID=202261 RepID=A0ABV9DKG8_9BACI